jgi:hypothetical protein
MLTIYRRHLKLCSHRSRNYKRCQRPIWVQGTLGNESVRETSHHRRSKLPVPGRGVWSWTRIPDYQITDLIRHYLDLVLAEGRT